MLELQSIDSSKIDLIERALDQDGACIALKMLPSAVCEGLLADFEPFVQSKSLGVDDLGYRDEFYGAQTKRLHGLFSKSKLMAQVLQQPLLLELCRRRFVETGLSNDVRLSNAELMVLHQDQEQQVLHRDSASWQLAQSACAQDLLLSANYALTDFTSDNGATCVAPGSHRWPQDRVPNATGTCLAVMPRGSALLYLGNVLHAGGANRTQKPRSGLYLGYAVSWLRPLENHLVTNDPNAVHALDPDAQRLLDVSPGGFTVYA